MNRNLSQPVDKKACSSFDELKELFTDPSLKKSKKVGNEKKKKEENNDLNTGLDIEAGAPNVKVEKPSKAQVANSLMTRRITIAGGFLDIALFTANCEQLKFVLELGQFHTYYKHVLGLLIASMILQLLVGVAMFLLGCEVLQRMSDESYSNILNQITMGLVALITIINIFISTFGPKGTAIARCLAAFSFPKTSGPLWMSYMNATRNFLGSENTH